MSGIRKKNIELLSASRRMDEKRRDAIHKIVYLAAAPVLLLCIILFTTCTYKARTVFYESETERILHFLEQEETQRRTERIEALQGKIELFHEFRENLEHAVKYLDSLVSITEEKLNLIMKRLPVGIEIKQVSFRNSQIVLTGSAEDYSQIASYIRQLEETGVFPHILYDGFSQNSAGLYDFKLTCCLS